MIGVVGDFHTVNISSVPLCASLCLSVSGERSPLHLDRTKGSEPPKVYGSSEPSARNPGSDSHDTNCGHNVPAQGVSLFQDVSG